MATATPEASTVFVGLRSEVQKYFSETHQKQQGPGAMYGKTAVILVSWAASYLALMLYGPHYLWVAAVGVLVLAFFTLAVELSVMHDISHGSLSDKRWVNTALNVTLTLVGGSSVLWFQKHVVRHHGHTNVPGLDADIDTDGMFRFRSVDEFRPIHRFQHIYAWFLYSFLVLEWVWYNDSIKAFGNVYNLRGKQYVWMWVEFIVSKIAHVLLSIVFPYLAFQSVGVVLALYLVHWLILGLIISVIFQLAHVGSNQSFPERNDSDWAVHQLRTTADFAVDNRFITWVVGGLNFQVEHHIFPRMCHIHYPKVQQIVKAYCHKHHVEYVEFPTLWDAVKDHYRHLYALSQPPLALEQQKAA